MLWQNKSHKQEMAVCWKFQTDCRSNMILYWAICPEAVNMEVHLGIIVTKRIGLMNNTLPILTKIPFKTQGNIVLQCGGYFKHLKEV